MFYLDSDKEDADDADGVQSDADSELVSWMRSLDVDQDTIRVVRALLFCYCRNLWLSFSMQKIHCFQKICRGKKL